MGLADFYVSSYGNNGQGNSAVGQYNSGDSYIVFGKTDSNAIDLSHLEHKGVTVPKDYADGSSAAGFLDFNGDGFGDLYINSYNSPGKLFFGGNTFNAEPTIEGSTSDSLTTFTGNERSNLIVGTSGNDVIWAKGGADVIYTSAGYDRIVLAQSNLDALSEGGKTTNADGSEINFGAGRLARVDGGAGDNGLLFEDDVTNIDLTKISNAGVGFIETGVGISRIANINQIDLSNTSNGEDVSRTLTLELKDVLDMNHHILSFGGNDFTGLTDSLASRHQLIIDGTSNDRVVVKGSAGEWNQTPTMVHSTNNAHTEYKVYNSTGDHGGQLIVHHDVEVTFEIV